MIRNSRARNWRFTENNPEGDLKELFGLLLDKQILEYAVYQLEVGEEGTEHHQGLMVFKAQVYFTTVKKILPRANLDVCYDPVAMRNYCMKDDGTKRTSFRLDGPYEIGQWHPPAEKMNVFNHIAEEFKSGKSFKEVALANPGVYVRYTKGLQALWSLTQPERNFKTYITLIVGPPNIGKSRYVFDREKDVYNKPHSEWFDGYYNQEAILFDDFYGYIKYSELLTLTDRYPIQVPFKGGYNQFNPKRIYFTSNVWPHQWYKNLDRTTVDFTALLRRFDKLIYWDAMEQKFNVVENPLEFLKARCI